MSLALNSAHDIHNGSRTAIAVVTEGDAVAQEILTRLRLFRGEWFLDVNAGTPWYEDVLTVTDVRTIELAIKRQILSVSGVVSITAFSLAVDRATRGAAVVFEVLTTFGPSDVLEVTV